MRFLGFDFEFGRGCSDCKRLERENASLREQMRLLGEAQVEMLDEIKRLRKVAYGPSQEYWREAKAILDLADLRPVP